MAEKACAKCGQVKPFAEFAKATANKSGLHSFCKECSREKTALWRTQNPEKLKQLNHMQYVRRKANGYHDAHIAAYWLKYRERFSAAAVKRAAKWNAANPEKAQNAMRNSSHKRRAQTKGQTVSLVHLEDILKRDGYHCYLCNKAITDGKIHFDHVVPLSKGGAHHPDNLKVTHPSCNLHKSNRSVEEWKAIYGEL